jgi:hypothetical protein
MTANRRFESVTIAAWSVGILGTFLLMALLLWAMYHYTRPDPLGADRVQERHQFLREIRTADAQALQDYAWIDQSKGFVRIPLERALELTVREWQDPAAARARLIERVGQVFAEPPAAPEPENSNE